MKRMFVLVLVVVLATASPAAATGPKTVRVSVSSAEVQSDSHSEVSSISDDGRYVAFWSLAGNLVAFDSAACGGFQCGDIFVRDRSTGTTTMASVSSGGIQGNDGSFGLKLSANGRYVVFDSYATNLAPGDTNGIKDVFVRDRVAKTTSLVSFAPDGTQMDIADIVAITPDARNVLMYGASHGKYGLYLRDRSLAKTTKVPVGDGVYQAELSSDARFLAFTDDRQRDPRAVPGRANVYVLDRSTGKVRLVSGAAAGLPTDADYFDPSMSRDGRLIAYSGFRSGSPQQVYVTDRTTGATQLVSATPDGSPANDLSDDPAMSGDGRSVAFASYATNLDCTSILCSRPELGDGEFRTYVRDLAAGRTTPVSVSTAGEPANSWAGGAAISRTGRYISFTSPASNLVPNDTDGWEDIFVRDRGA